MTYQRLPLKDLRALAEELDRTYHSVNSNRKNPQRKSFLALYKEIVNATANQTADNEQLVDILTGAALFEMEHIKSEYSYLSPEGSDLYSLLKRKLKITQQNPLKDDERLVYLHKFNKYVQNTLTDENLKNVKESVVQTAWKTKQDLLKNIHGTLKHLRKRDAERIGSLVHGTPNLIALQKNMQEIRKKYRAARDKHRWKMFQSKKREAMCDISEFIHETCNDFYYANYQQDGSAPNRQTVKSQTDECNTRLGLSLSILLEINNEYRLLSPKGGWFNGGSELYKELLPILNITELNQLQYDDKIAWLRALEIHIDEVRNDKQYYQNLTEKWKRRGINDLDKELVKFQDQIRAFRNEQEKEKNLPSRTTRVVTTGLSYATQCGLMYGISYAVGQGVTRYALSGVGSAIAATIGGPIGFAIYAGSTILMTGLSALISNNALSYTTASLFAWVLEKISDNVADAAVGIISYQFSASKEGLDKLRRELSPENERLFREWVNTLLDLPSDIVSEQEKDQIRNVLGLAKDERLQPLPPTQVGEQEKRRAAELLAKEFISKRDNNELVITDEYQPRVRV